MLSYACYALMCASNNELKLEYNSNDDIPQRFEVLQSFKIELKWQKRIWQFYQIKFLKKVG